MPPPASLRLSVTALMVAFKVMGCGGLLVMSGIKRLSALALYFVFFAGMNIANAQLRYANNGTPTPELLSKVDAQLARMKKDFPLKLNEFSTIMNAERYDTVISYTYKDNVDVPNLDGIDIAGFVAHMRGNMCKDSMAVLMNAGFTIHAIHLDMNSRYITTIVVDREICNL